MVGSTSTAYFKGASSYYLFALADADRYAVLDALKSGGFTVVRIFIASVQQNNKGSNNAYVPDLEPKEVGAYDDTILSKVDQLMYDCKARGLKLIIALHDRYALGFWSTDTYATQFNIVAAGSSGAQKVSNAATFYTSSKAISSFQNRLKHILNHQNSLLGGKTWAQLSDVVYAFEAENEPQGHMATASSSWVCDRSKFLKTLLPSGSSIKISSGGGITTTDSLGNWAMGCSSLDIVSVHDYGTNPAVTVAAIVQANSVAKQSGKTVILGEWGITGSNKATIIGQFVSALKKAKVSWMYWEVVKPGKAASDFEVWTDEPSWAKLTA
ncbi:glycoside hydrolase [Meredithblackwellia eburnea MCA 4105]